MRKQKKMQFYQLLVILLLFIGIGYAALTTDLSINGISHVTGSSWDVHFANIQVKEGSVIADSPANIDTDTSVSYRVTLSKPGDFYEFTVDVENEGTIDAMLESISSKLNSVEITTLPNYVEYSITYKDNIVIAPYHLLEAGRSETYKVRIAYKKDINPEDLPSSDETFNLLFAVSHVQADENAISRPLPPTIKATSSSDTTAFRSSTYKSSIKIINLSDEINPPANVIASWDVGVNQNGDVMAYITRNANDSLKYDLYIQGDGALYANQDSSFLFYNFQNIDSINNIEVLNTSKVTNMRAMFSETGQNSTVFTLDLGNNFDTSNVENMSSMFSMCGHSNTAYTLNLGDKFDTGKVINMYGMFYSTGYHSTNFTLDLGNNFDTSNVENMSYMFASTGSRSTVFTLDLGNKFDTSKVTNMSYMFYSTGRECTNFTLDLGNNFDTSNVEDMSCMFDATGYNSTVFTLDIGNKFYTSKVTNMSNMFNFTGYNNNTFTIDLSTFDFSNVTSMDNMFIGWRPTQKIYVKDATDQAWVISNSGNVSISPYNVLIKS